MSPNKTVLSLLIIAMAMPSLASAAPAKRASGKTPIAHSARGEEAEGDDAPRPAPRISSAPSHASVPAPRQVETRHEESRPTPAPARPATPAPRPPVVEQRHEEKREERSEERPATPVARPATPVVVNNVPAHTAPARTFIPPKPSEPARAHVEVVRTKSGNVVSQVHTAHIEESHKREQVVMRNNTRVTTVVNVHATTYRTEYRPVFVNRYNVYQQTYYPRYHEAYRPWYHYGFRGGFYYPVTPIYDIHESFYNPIIFWMYADNYDETYYNTWYGSDFYSYREMQSRFSRPGVFFPTQTIRDLGMGVSSMPIRQQANFRAGLTRLADQLEWKLREGLDSSIMLGRNDIVISHFETLNDALVIEGFVSADARQFPFKAMFDLNNVDMNMVFVPASYDGAPTNDQLADLRELNERIAYYGGTVITDDGDIAPLPAPMPINPTPTPVIIYQPDPTPPRVIYVEPRGRRGD